jgi:hypothetical protein
VRRHCWINTQGERRAMMLEVQAGMVGRTRDDAERLDTERSKLGSDATEPSHCASAEGTIRPSEEAKEHRAATKDIAQRYAAVPVGRGQYELGRTVAGFDQGMLVGHSRPAGGARF